jgi:hypothetical protein
MEETKKREWGDRGKAEREREREKKFKDKGVEIVLRHRQIGFLSI